MDSTPESLSSDEEQRPAGLDSKPPGPVPAGSAVPIYINPDHMMGNRTEDTRRLVRLLWIFAILLVALITPTIVGKIRYSYSYNAERGKVDASLEALRQLDLSELSMAFRYVAKIVGPSVVNIQTTRVVSTPRFYDERRHLFGNPQPYALQGQGSGVIVDPDGYIVTNNHVVSNAESIIVQLSNGHQALAKVIGSDLLTDIAVLKVDATDLIALQWGDSDQLEVGSMVWAVGSPFGLQSSITFGIISAKDRRGVTRSLLQNFIQTDAAVNPGNSGGPLINIDGEIVGINTAIVGQAYQGISFAIPSNTAYKVFKTIREKGHIERGWLGVALQDIDPDPKNDMTPSTPGVLVVGVLEDSPAAQAGLQPGDLILEWNGIKVSDPTTFSLLVAESEIGAEIPIRIVRQQQERKLTVTVAKRPSRIE